MTVVAGPIVPGVTNSTGLIYFIDPGNSKSFASSENLYPNGESLTSLFSSPPAGTYSVVTTGGPYNGTYVSATWTGTSAQSNYWFEWGNLVTVNQGDNVTQTWHVRPIVTASNTLTNVGLRFWSGAGRAWSGFYYVQFNLPTMTISQQSGTGTTATIVLLSNGWYKLTMTSTADQTGYSGASLYNNGLMTTGTVYHFGAVQVERNATPTPYTPTYGTAIARATSLVDLSGAQSIVSTITNLKPCFVSANGGYLNLGSVNYSNTAVNTLQNTYVASPLGPTYFSAASDFSISTWVNFGPQYSTQTNVMGTLAASFAFNGWGIQWFGGTSTYQVNTWIRTSAGIVSVFGGDAINQGGTGTGGTGGWTVNTSTWYNLAMVYSNINTYHAMYLNGSLIGTASPALITGTFVVTNPGFNLGSPNGAGGGALQVPFPGSFGPTYVYNRMLSAQEIQQLYAAHRGRFGL